jgi:hypothetical protein
VRDGARAPHTCVRVCAPQVTAAALSHNCTPALVLPRQTLELVGTGFRATVANKELTLNVGYCVPRVLAIPEGITVKVSCLRRLVLGDVGASRGRPV